MEGYSPQRIKKNMYVDYLEQVKCLTSRMEVLFRHINTKRASEQLVFIVHGDHGSRITSQDIWDGDNGNMTPFDYVNAYSTLFAVKLPGQQAKVFDEPVSINYLVSELLSGGFQRLPEPRRQEADPDVYLEVEGKSVHRPFVWPELGWP